MSLKSTYVWSALLLGAWLFSPGCQWRATLTEDAAPAEPLVWIEQGLDHHGATIRLGVRGPTAAATQTVEPVASITRDGAPVAGAMVFVVLHAGEASAPLGNERPTLYEASPGDTPPLYTPGKVAIDEGVSPSAATFRIALPGAEDDFTRQMPLP
jgi:hypothetical protein